MKSQMKKKNKQSAEREFSRDTVYHEEEKADLFAILPFSESTEYLDTVAMKLLTSVNDFKKAQQEDRFISQVILYVNQKSYEPNLTKKKKQKIRISALNCIIDENGLLCKVVKANEKQITERKI